MRSRCLLIVGLVFASLSAACGGGSTESSPTPKTGAMVFPDSINGMYRLGEGGPGGTNDHSGAEECCDGWTYGTDRFNKTYLLVLFHPWVMQPPNPVDHYLQRGLTAGQGGLYQEEDGVRYVCFEDEYVYESKVSGCYWDADDFFGLLAAFDETTPKEDLMEITREVRADVSALNA